MQQNKINKMKKSYIVLKAKEKICVLRRDLKTGKEACLMCRGTLFQSFGAATATIPSELPLSFWHNQEQLISRPESAGGCIRKKLREVGRGKAIEGFKNN